MNTNMHMIMWQQTAACDSAHQICLDQLIAQTNGQLAKRQLQQAVETRAWLTTIPHVLNGMVLSADEFQENLCLWLGLRPLNLPAHCDGSYSCFTVSHALSCPKAGLTLHCHNNVAGEWHQLCAEALKPSTVTDGLQIPVYQPAPGNRALAGALPPPALWGDIGVHGFWQQGMAAIFDIHIIDTDAWSHQHKQPLDVLRTQEKEKKAWYNTACCEAHCHFTLLVYSVDGTTIEGPKAKSARNALATLLAQRWGQHKSHVCHIVHSCLAFALAQAT